MAVGGPEPGGHPGSTERTSSFDSTADLVAEACRVLGKLDMTHSALGHVSCRLDDERMLIKGKGPDEVGLRYTQPDDIIEVDFQAKAVAGRDGLRAPSESFIHIWLYRLNPELRSVVHVHPPEAVLLTISGKEVKPIYGAFGPGAQLAIEGVPVYPRSVRVSDDELGREFAEFMGSKRCVLMHGHGVSAAGTSVEDAVVQTIVLNELTSMNYRAHLIGTPQSIPEQDMAAFADPPDPDRPRGSAGGRAGVLATYRYYRALAGEGSPRSA